MPRFQNRRFNSAWPRIDLDAAVREREPFRFRRLESGSRGAMRKLIAFDDNTLDKLTQLGRDRMATFRSLPIRRVRPAQEARYSHRSERRPAQERGSRRRTEAGR